MTFELLELVLINSKSDLIYQLNKNKIEKFVKQNGIIFEIPRALLWL